MKVVAFNGSARKKGNTTMLLEAVLQPLAEAGAETELVELAGTNPKGCKACYVCFKEKDGTCAVKDDIINECIAKMVQADAIILGSPTYFADVSSEMKALIDRCGMVSRANGDLYRRKLGASVVAARRAGAIHAFDSMNHFFLIGQMIVVGSSYWNIGHGREKGDVSGDEEGMKTMRQLGENMAWLLTKLHGA
ncbi:flavodoxin family protein [Desulfofustis glycolicus]|jgi:multimeric flavodoxin WrbA|uniref:Multimeric flavodoxin WrbA n=1 Tax=Desulfofustis glycolicus DSM 9705 TaxID=1121409 RepID=A0A1M5T4Q6_9BACT|nr:flavodoxin family protein [Desulfofustis glycolicus]MCB2215355.1 flavodoxin family protein [Desulfobulbaceae bacterium]SHH45570.1 Multimeric flavodoxin WrbA [Desulfofustis glycolicus DSM 9705]